MSPDPDKEYATKEDLKELGKELREEFREGFKSFKDEIIRYFRIISEDLCTQIKQVAEGVANVYEKSERDVGELKREIQETRHEVLAAVKFSYAELDRRITTLENDFIDLKRRIEKIENRSMA